VKIAGLLNTMFNFSFCCYIDVFVGIVSVLAVVVSFILVFLSVVFCLNVF
jgi:hypothetical protein